MIGNKDVFYDDCWRFMKKLKKVGNDCHFYVYEDVRHGILTQYTNISSGEIFISDIEKII